MSDLGLNRQMNMDYSLCQALTYRMDGIPSALVFYDVMCQYYKKFHQRVSENPYLNLPSDLTILKSIGLFHVHGHQDVCFARFAPNFIPGAGQIDGEVLETLWAVLNEISRSTRGASAAHRREILDDHMNDSNWKKLIGIGNDCSILACCSNVIQPLHSSSTSKEISTSRNRLRGEFGSIYRAYGICGPQIDSAVDCRGR